MKLTAILRFLNKPISHNTDASLLKHKHPETDHCTCNTKLLMYLHANVSWLCS